LGHAHNADVEKGFFQCHSVGVLLAFVRAEHFKFCPVAFDVNFGEEIRLRGTRRAIGLKIITKFISL